MMRSIFSHIWLTNYIISIISEYSSSFMFIYCSQDTCGCSHIEEVKGATSAENYKSHVQFRPLFQPITALRCVSEEAPGLFGMLSDHVQTTTFSWVRLRVNLLISSISSLSSTSEATIPGLSQHVSGESGHQEPGDPGSQARRHPRFCPHAPGLLHDSGRDRVQHYPGR